MGTYVYDERCSSSDVAKVRPSNLFLWPLDLFLLFGKAILYGLLRQKLNILHLIKHQKDQFFSAFMSVVLNSAARDDFFFQIWPAIKNSGHPCSRSYTMLSSFLNKWSIKLNKIFFLFGTIYTVFKEQITF